jgi:hypothetical protein
MTTGDDYLTMARIMETELEKWKKHENNNWRWRAMTGMEQLTAKDAFKDGFMAGFQGKYFGGTNG